MDSSTITNNQIFDWLERNNRLFPDKIFIHSIDQEKSITYGAAYDCCHRIAAYLNNLGLRANDRVALLSNNSLEHLMTYFGVMVYGATICTIHVEMNSLYLSDILRQINPKLVLVEDSICLDPLEEMPTADILPLGEWAETGGSGFFGELCGGEKGKALRPVNAPSDIAEIFYTSGTTSTPKGVMCTFEQLCENTDSVMDGFAISNEDRVLDFRSFNWLSAQILSATGPLSRGATILLGRKFSASRFFDWVRNYRATIATGNPTIINMLINRPTDIDKFDIPDFRYITSSSAPLLAQDWKKFEDMYNIPIAQGFGASEAGWLAASNEENRRIGSVGKPLPYHKIRIVDEQGNEMPPNETGRIELGRDPETAYRYIENNAPAQLAESGFIQTGDIGYLDEDGFLFVTGRERDLIIRGGVNISPVEIENVALELANISQAAAIGVPDEIYGEEIVLFIVPADGSAINIETVRQHCQSRLNKVKIPKYIEIYEDLPKTDRGKLDRRSLRGFCSNPKEET